jgi:UDP-N-acetylglucosamine 2-epimerase (non-hydrolysing)
METLKVMLVAGARPNFMKIAPLMKAISKRNSRANNGSRRIDAILLHTGQHYDEAMSGVFFRELGIRPPDINLGVGSGSHGVQTAGIMTAFEEVCQKEKPDWVVVVGDVNSTMACTLVCSKMGIKVAHVEAGLRSFDRSMPEEVNRIVTDALADLLLTPSPDASENLKQEGIAHNKIACVGNIMIDALIANLNKSRASDLPRQLRLVHQGFVYVTLHRPSNVDDARSLAAIIAELERVSRELPVVFPMHPRTRKMCAQFGIALDANHGLKILDPIGYHDSLCLTENARLVLTDSGGLQEESTYFRTPCLTLRPNTERPITVTVGSNKLTHPERLRLDINEVLNRQPRFGEIPALWDGRTAERVVRSLLEFNYEGKQSMLTIKPAFAGLDRSYPCHNRAAPVPNDLKRVTLKLLAYCGTQDWSGYDPYDALNSPLFTALPVLNCRLSRLILTQFLKRSPLNIRPLLGIPKTRNPKAIALFLASLLKLSKLDLLKSPELVRLLIDHLLALRSPGTDHCCWGYSFPWQTRTMVVPRGAPNLVCTTFVAGALLDAYQEIGNPRFLEIATSAGEYILNELYYTEGDMVASFSYPLPASKAKVHNANFLAASLFCRLHHHTGNEALLNAAVRVTRYSAAKQKSDGSWHYGELPTQRWIDNFHTGYNLTALRAICRYLGTSEFEPHVRRGFEFYREHFFREDGAVRYFHDRTYPIDIHCVAQSLLTLLEFRDLDTTNIGLARLIYAWAMKHMWDDAGFFYYRVLRTLTIRTSYIRWSQAWMLLALVTLAEHEAK